MTCDQKKTYFFFRICREWSDLIREDNFESIHRRVTTLSEDCSSNQEKTQQDHENKTNHQDAMKILKRLFDDWSKLLFFQFFKKINRTIFQKRRSKTNHQSRDTSCDAFNVKSKIHHSDHCQWYHFRFEFEFALFFAWNNASNREIFRERRSICLNKQVDVFTNFNQFVIIIIRR
jgi:hypothetical protein